MIPNSFKQLGLRLISSQFGKRFEDGKVHHMREKMRRSLQKSRGVKMEAYNEMATSVGVEYPSGQMIH